MAGIFLKKSSFKFGQIISINYAELWLPWQCKEKIVKSFKFFLSEIMSHRALVFCMWTYLEVLYKDLSNYVPGSKLVPPLGTLSFTIYHIVKSFKKNSCPKLWGLKFWYLVCGIILRSSTKIGQIMPQGKNKPCPLGPLVLLYII